MYEDLYNLVTIILSEYNRIYDKWKKHPLYRQINQKKKLVKDIYNDNSILNTIFNYRAFLSKNYFTLEDAFHKLNLTNTVSSRVKTKNSLEDKIANYMSEKHENGFIPMNKCINDICGIRIVFKDNIIYKDIKHFIETRFNEKLKCIDSSNLNYVATHIYFKCGNESFQWELQIWDKAHEETNIILHEQYKQDYIKWEKEKSKGGI